MIELWKDQKAMRRLESEQYQKKVGPVEIQMVRFGGLPFVRGIERKFAYHSPIGFEWGFLGSGPADLALNILYCYRDFQTAWRLHQEFKSDFLTKIPHEGGVLTGKQIETWLDEVEG